MKVGKLAAAAAVGAVVALVGVAAPASAEVEKGDFVNSCGPQFSLQVVGPDGAPKTLKATVCIESYTSGYWPYTSRTKTPYLRLYSFNNVPLVIHEVQLRLATDTVARNHGTVEVSSVTLWGHPGGDVSSAPDFGLAEFYYTSPSGLKKFAGVSPPDFT
ncbi:hypothetical protein I6A84_43840 [Frankia sp. CNm7]|uniref:Secreted protein n=1 Tax=Frankia nepalensis TaxID=1836974 RepID=A0A937ULZ2_9ACTN|nr:hypothetical protein [Frankia nepalensis]MBL7494814.1 hypothetical protein [Frankia nepalensis]MBL7508963.1 hypothetical protein [Frankia nepalensis]MBL7524793.1 hypothetical protein [Frankia nepalensis]MBL7626297.1 hypothetical protein [Frankia nepalensis]